MQALPIWNFAVLVDAIARASPEREAVVQGSRRLTWHQLASRARLLAWYLHNEGGLRPGDKVAIALPNCVEYLETFVAARKLHGVPLNVGTGPSVDALHRVIDASDAKIVVHAPANAPATHDAARRIPKRWRPLTVEVGERYERAIATATPPSEWEIETPSADDLIFLATHDLAAGSTESGETLLPVAPLAFGTGLAAALRTLSAQGRVVFADSAAFDPHLVWRTVEQERVVTLTIGGDADARPLLAALATATTGRSLTTLRTISSSGAPLGLDVASALEAALPNVTIVDSYEGPEQQAPDAWKMIRPSDVEARLRKHSSVADCVVVGISDPRLGKRVVALIQVADGHYLDAPEIAAWCQAHLPSTMTPGRFLFVEHIERSTSGEADYPALRDLALDRLLHEQ